MAGKSKKAASDVKSIYVISGKDKYLVAKECEKLLDGLLTHEQRAMALYQPEVEGPERVQISDVLDELRTLPFLAERRVVLLKDADGFISANRGPLEDYFDKPSKSGVLILVVSTWAKNTRLAKKLNTAGHLIDVSEVKPWHLAGYACECCRTEHGKTMNMQTAKLLVELVGDDSGRISSEVAKLAMYVGDRKNIKTDDVEKLIGHNRMFNAFAVIDAITAGDITGAMKRLRNMFEMDKSAEYTVVGAFAYHFRRMFNAKVLREKGMSPEQVTKKLGMWGNNSGFFRQLSSMSLGRIGAVISELARIDYSIKSGRMTAKVAIERLVMKVSLK